MIKVLFFARLREELGCSALDIAFSGTVAELKAKLSERGEQWGTLQGENIVCAVNQSVAKENRQISEGDEIAFYPPVTGG